jgi:putative oxidoreductase
MMHRFSRVQGQIISLFRIVFGLLFLCHGASSIFGVPASAVSHGRTLATFAWPSWWAAAIQLLCGALVLVGLATRPAALLASGSMAYAYFTVHQERALLPIQNGGELAAMFCWSFLLLVIVGPGTWSLDALLGKANRTGFNRTPANAEERQTANA